eukprot:scaffold2857_cov399-Prasinococcus_capsulatus_cf.AAC.3
MPRACPVSPRAGRTSRLAILTLALAAAESSASLSSAVWTSAEDLVASSRCERAFLLWGRVQAWRACWARRRWTGRRRSALKAVGRCDALLATSGRS